MNTEKISWDNTLGGFSSESKEGRRKVESIRDEEVLFTHQATKTVPGNEVKELNRLVPWPRGGLTLGRINTYIQFKIFWKCTE